MMIGLVGKAGSGKTTAAHFLVHDYGCKLVKFAGPLKAMLRTIGLSEAHTDGPLKELPCPILCGKTPRYAMQTLGTEWGRQMIGGEIWVRAAMHEAHQWRHVVFDDVRYLNEAMAIHQAGGVIWRIDRPETLAVPAHASESEMDGIVVDAQITNNGTPAQLREAIHALVLACY